MSFKVKSNVPKATKQMTSITVGQFQNVNEAFNGEIKVRSPYQFGGNRRGIVLLKVIRRGARYVWRHVGETAYAAFLELGTKKMPARPYFRPAFDWTKRNLKRLLSA